MNQPHASSTTSRTNSSARNQPAANTTGGLAGSLGNISQKIGNSFNKLSTTQKIVGGVLLALGIRYFTKSSQDDTQQDDESAATSGSASETLHELLHFVNDRIEGYQRAVDESQDAQLRGYYKQLVSQSQQFANQLNDFLRKQGGGRETSTTLKGKLYRGWMDAKALLTGGDEKAILNANVYGEEWALKAYKDALDDQTLTGTMRTTVERQYELSQDTYKRLQNLEEKQ